MKKGEKAIRYMVARQAMVDTVEDILNKVNEMSEAFHLDAPEFLIVFLMDMLHTAVKTGEEMGFHTDLRAYAEAVMADVEGEG